MKAMTAKTIVNCNCKAHDFRQSLGAYFKYLIDTTKPGHDLDDGSAPVVFNFGFGDDIFADLQDVNAAFAAGKKAKLMHRNATEDARLYRIDLFHGLDLYDDAYEIAERLSARTPKFRSVFVIHEKKKDGRKFWHMHWIQEARDRETMKPMPDDLRRSHVSYTRSVIAQVYQEKEVQVRGSYGQYFKANRTYFREIPRIAMHDTIRCGETDIRAGQTKRLQSPAWLKKVAINELEGENIMSVEIREGARIKAEHALHNLLVRNAPPKMGWNGDLERNLKMSRVLKVTKENTREETAVDAPKKMKVLKITMKRPDPERRALALEAARVRDVEVIEAANLPLLDGEELVPRVGKISVTTVKSESVKVSVPRFDSKTGSLKVAATQAIKDVPGKTLIIKGRR